MLRFSRRGSTSWFTSNHASVQSNTAVSALGDVEVYDVFRLGDGLQLERQRRHGCRQLAPAGERQRPSGASWTPSARGHSGVISQSSPAPRSLRLKNREHSAQHCYARLRRAEHVRRAAQPHLNLSLTVARPQAFNIALMPTRLPKIVVTGAAGFIGSHLVDRLLADGAGTIVGFDNLSRGRLENLAQLRTEPRFELVEGDVRDHAAASDVVRGASLIYHLAAQSTLRGALHDMEYTFATNVRGTFNVLRAAVESNVPRVVFTSSRDVYGEPVNLPVEEESPLLAINSYGASKVAGEVYCRAVRREFGLQTVILRLASVYGLRDIGRVIPTWLHQAQTGEKMHIYGGKQVLDFVWIGLVIEALVRSGKLDGPLPPINIGSGTGTRIVDLARRIGRLVECQPRIQLEPARSMEVNRFIAKVDRMRQILLIEPLLDPLANLAELVAVPVQVLS